MNTDVNPCEWVLRFCVEKFTGPVPLLIFVLAAVLFVRWGYLVFRRRPTRFLGTTIVSLVAAGYVLNDWRYLLLNLRMTDIQTIRSDCNHLLQRFNALPEPKHILLLEKQEIPSSFLNLGAEAVDVSDGKTVAIILHYNPIGSCRGIVYDPKRTIDPTLPREFRGMWYQDFYWFWGAH